MTIIDKDAFEDAQIMSRLAVEGELYLIGSESFWAAAMKALKQAYGVI